MFTIFNQLYNFHCLHNLCNGKTNIKMAYTNDSVAYAYAISSKTQELSVQPNTFRFRSGLFPSGCTTKVVQFNSLYFNL
jgi:hypothetical protein